MEQYHTPLCYIYKVISEELAGTTVGKAILLQLLVKAVNNTIGPDGLVPTLLVFGSYPRLSESDPPSPSITQRAAAIKKATQELLKLQVNR